MESFNAIQTIKELLAPLFKKNEVIKATMFGSTSKSSETKKSDLDLVIIKNTRNRFFDRYYEFAEINISILNPVPKRLVTCAQSLKLKLITMSCFVAGKLSFDLDLAA